MEGIGLGLQMRGVVVPVRRRQVAGEHPILPVAPKLFSCTPLFKTAFERVVGGLTRCGQVDGETAVRGSGGVVAVVVGHLSVGEGVMGGWAGGGRGREEVRGLRAWVDSAPKIVVVLVLVLQQERDLERGGGEGWQERQRRKV